MIFSPLFFSLSSYHIHGVHSDERASNSPERRRRNRAMSMNLENFSVSLKSDEKKYSQTFTKNTLLCLCHKYFHWNPIFKSFHDFLTQLMLQLRRNWLIKLNLQLILTWLIFCASDFVTRLCNIILKGNFFFFYSRIQCGDKLGENFKPWPMLLHGHQDVLWLDNKLNKSMLDPLTWKNFGLSLEDFLK